MNRKADEEFLTQLRAMYTPGTASKLQLKLMPESSLGNWLGELRLLTGVPFTNLVANPRLLPRESIRFFYVDENWLDALQDGATSIGLHSSRDSTHQSNMKRALTREAEVAAQQHRRRRRGKPLAEFVTIGNVRTGFLLRSAVVAGWPGLEVRGFADRDGTESIELLRLERLAPDVMICIFSGQQGIPVRIDINEPSEGLQFGLDLRPVTEDNGEFDRVIAPRWPGFTQPERTGQVITCDRARWVEAVMRQKQGRDTRVLDVLAVSERLKSRLIDLRAMTPNDKLTSAHFALQMVKSPEQQPFISDETMPLTQQIPSPSETIDVRALAAVDEDELFEELFRS
jgi:hypothetical protein